MAKEKKPEDGPLEVSVVDGKLVISIGINTLASAAATGDAFHKYDDETGDCIRNFAISDAAEYAKDVGHELEREAENGDTPLTRLLDDVMQYAIDEGSTAIEHDQRIKYGERAECEKKWSVTAP